MNRRRDLQLSLATTEDVIVQLEYILDGGETGVVFAPDPDIGRAHRYAITDDDLSVINEKFEAELVLPGFRALRDAYKAKLAELDDVEDAT